MLFPKERIANPPPPPPLQFLSKGDHQRLVHLRGKKNFRGSKMGRYRQQIEIQKTCLTLRYKIERDQIGTPQGTTKMVHLRGIKISYERLDPIAFCWKGWHSLPCFPKMLPDKKKIVFKIRTPTERSLQEQCLYVVNLSTLYFIPRRASIKPGHLAGR